MVVAPPTHDSHDNRGTNFHLLHFQPWPIELTLHSLQPTNPAKFLSFILTLEDNQPHHEPFVKKKKKRTKTKKKLIEKHNLKNIIKRENKTNCFVDFFFRWRLESPLAQEEREEEDVNIYALVFVN
jgi:hypothetical protein